MLREFRELLFQLEAAPGKNDKIKLIKMILDHHPELGKLFELALSPYITFGVAKLPPSDGQLNHPPGDETWLSLLDQLAARQLTGNAAHDAIRNCRALMTVEQREAFDRILLKDLRCGVAAETINKAKPGTVPVFSCQLAPSEMPMLGSLTYPVQVEPKLDGVRTIAIKRNGVVELFSRNGKPHENFVELANALTALPEGTVLDGEVMSPHGFAALMTRAKAKTGKAVDVPIQFVVFDGMRLDMWDKQSCHWGLSQRRNFLKELVRLEVISSLVTVVDHRICATPAEVETYYAELVEQGFEGAMLKHPDGLYTFKRNATWMKLKPFDTVDLKVIEIIPGKGKYEGLMGALLCEGEHHGKQIRTEVGSGFTDTQRAEDWLGAVIEVRYQEITQAQGSDTWALRFPSLVRRRPDKKEAAE